MAKKDFEELENTDVFEPEMNYSFEHIKSNGENSIIEVEGKRYVIPTKILNGLYISEKQLNMAIPYGIDFEEVLQIKFNIDDVVTSLHKREIWTAEDVMKHPNEVISALQENLHLTLADLLSNLNTLKERK